MNNRKMTKIITPNQMDVLSGNRKCSKDTRRKNRDRARARTKKILQELAVLAQKCPDALRNEDIENLVRAKLEHGEINEHEISRSRLPQSADEKRSRVDCIQNDGVIRGKRGVPIDKPELRDKTVFAHNLLQAVFENLTLIVPSVKDVAGYKDVDFLSIVDKYRVIRLCQKGKKVTPLLYHCLNLEDSRIVENFQKLMSIGVVKSSEENEATVNCLVLPLGSADPEKVTVIILEQ